MGDLDVGLLNHLVAGCVVLHDKSDRKGAGGLVLMGGILLGGR